MLLDRTTSGITSHHYINMAFEDAAADEVGMLSSRRRSNAIPLVLQQTQTVAMVARGPSYIAPSKPEIYLAREGGKHQAESRDRRAVSRDSLYFHPHYVREDGTSKGMHGTVSLEDERREENRRLRKEQGDLIDELFHCMQNEDLFLAHYTAASAACVHLEVLVAQFDAREDACAIPVPKVHPAFESSESASHALVNASSVLVITEQLKRVTRSSANASAALKRH